MKHHIPLKTDHWDLTAPGLTEIDLVSHCGDRADGTFLHSLNITNIHTTWVETRAVLSKGEVGLGSGCQPRMVWMTSAFWNTSSGWPWKMISPPSIA